MLSKRVKTTVISLMICALVAAVFAVPTDRAAFATSQTKATAKQTSKVQQKPKTVAINIAVMSETEAEVDIVVEKITKKKSSSLERTVDLKKGGNYFTYDKGKKGRYRVTINAFGDSMSQTVTAVQGKYTLLFKVAPPKDGDSKEKKPIVYQDLTKIKQKK